jgi:hypothetical protein
MADCTRYIGACHGFGRFNAPPGLSESPPDRVVDAPNSSDAVAPGTGTQALASERKRAPEPDAAFFAGGSATAAGRAPSRPFGD